MRYQPGKMSVARRRCSLPSTACRTRRQRSRRPPPRQTGNGSELEEVTVTANRREQTIEAVPYSLSVISADQLEQANVTDLASLSQSVPGLSMYVDFGARFAGAVAPVIRGINATAEPTRGFRTFEQNPVGTYIGNSPIDGYFQLDDLKQVEVLRGPQGTLYGAGALGGALRLIPNDPDTKAFGGSFEASGDRLSHSSGTGYTVKAMVNVPLADTFAVRLSGKYSYQPGFIDAYGLLKRDNNGLTGVPELADPADIVGSPGIYSNREDWNWQKTFTGRAAVLWKPVDAFSAELAFLHSNVRGDGGPVVNPDYQGGISPLDPLTTLPAGGHYQEFTQIDQPFSRYTNLSSLDLSYNVGFATLSSTSSYYTTTGSALQDNTYDLAGLYSGAYLPYYAGTPTNPRFVYDQLFTDKAHTFTEELRLVSTSGPDNMFDYVLGVFYEKQTRQGSWTIAIPGSPERAAQTACAPECDILVAPGDVNFQQIDTQNFTDRSVFGELTYHFLTHGQITFGVRHFSQSFTDAQSYVDYTFPTDLPATPHSSPASKTVGKVDPSYEYSKDQFVYALWSQGFRRGGANSVPLSGPFQESPLLATYQPDKTNNYEAGLKGRFSNGLSYTADVFYIKWDKPPDLLESAFGESRGLQRQLGGVERLRSGNERPVVPSRARLLVRLFVCGREAQQRLLAAGQRRGGYHPGRAPRLRRTADAREPQDQSQRGAVVRHADRARHRSGVVAQRRVPLGREDAAGAHPGCCHGATILVLRDLERERRRDPQAVACDRLRQQSHQQTGSAGAAGAGGRRQQPEHAGERLRHQSAARDRPASRILVLRRPV